MSVDSKFKATVRNLNEETRNGVRNETRNEARNGTKNESDAVQVAEPLQWNRTSVMFYPVAPGSDQEFSFKYLGTTPIKSIVPSCGCTSVKNTEGEITGTLKVAKDFSYAKDRMVEISKSISIHFEDDTTQVLTVQCKVDKWL